MSVAECTLCVAPEPSDGELDRLLIEEFWPDDSHPDYLGLKRELVAEYDCDVTVVGLKRHLNQHVQFGRDFTNGSNGSNGGQP